MLDGQERRVMGAFLSGWIHRHMRKCFWQRWNSAALITTMASADFWQARACQTSLGKNMRFPLVPRASTRNDLMGFGLRVCSHARRPFQASPALCLVKSLLGTSFSHDLAAAALSFGYG